MHEHPPLEHRALQVMLAAGIADEQKKPDHALTI
jgi:hypothetical protein